MWIRKPTVFAALLSGNQISMEGYLYLYFLLNEIEKEKGIYNVCNTSR